ncbi:tetraacyldisaccharide 4'-kinase [bacterium]|nr:tetraacyldisaccharide 4'-kinase [bacterium]
MRCFFAPIACLFAFFSYLRWLLYRVGIKRHKSLDAPVISVGNLAMGGTGKTPFTIWLADKLQSLGYSPVILTRGYGRTHKERMILIGDTTTARIAGDEPALIAQKLPDTPIVVHPNRFESAREIGNEKGRIFILDDGFQHIQLARDVDILLLPSEDPFSGEHFFPWGNLRDGLWRLKEASAIILMGETEKIPPELASLSCSVQTFSGKKIFAGIRTLVGKNVSPNILKNQNILLFAGLGAPSSFYSTIVETGANIRGTYWFKDHHIYTAKDISAIEHRAEEYDADLLVTTEKDAIRLTGMSSRLEIYVVDIELTITREADLIDLITSKLNIKKG